MFVLSSVAGVWVPAVRHERMRVNAEHPTLLGTAAAAAEPEPGDEGQGGAGGSASKADGKVKRTKRVQAAGQARRAPNGYMMQKGGAHIKGAHATTNFTRFENNGIGGMVPVETRQAGSHDADRLALAARKTAFVELEDDDDDI